MDKVIYINGVDVSGCEHYRAEIEIKMPYGEYEIQKDKCHYSGIEIIQNCKGNKGCIYKQLKRLEQENETLERTNNEMRKRFSEDTTKLSAELMELKADIESRTMCITCERELQNCNLQTENEQLKEEITKLSDPRYQISKVNEGYYNRMNTYKQALQEIRDIILSPEIIDEETKKLHTSEELDNIVRWHREDKLSKIQAKINEVIGAEE